MNSFYYKTINRQYIKILYTHDNLLYETTLGKMGYNNEPRFFVHRRLDVFWEMTW
jgi:hypothetical protein